MELNQTSICYYDKKLAHISAATESGFDCAGHVSRYRSNRVRVWYGGHQDQTPQNDRLLVSGTVQTTFAAEPENSGKRRRLSVPVTFACTGMRGVSAESVCSTVCRIAAVEPEA